MARRNHPAREVTLDCWRCAQPFTYMFVGGSYRETCDACKEVRRVESNEAKKPAQAAYRARTHWKPTGRPPTYNVAQYMVESGMRSTGDLDDQALRWLFRDLIERRQRGA